MLHSTIPKITDAELLVMQEIWNVPEPLTAKEIVQRIQGGANPDWKISTIRTLINRLVMKGCLSVYKRNGRRCYSAAIDRQTYLEEITKEFLLLHYGGSFSQMFVLWESGRPNLLTVEETQWLKQALSKFDIHKG